MNAKQRQSKIQSSWLTVSSILKKMNREEFKTDYCLQRSSGQWNTEVKSNLISTVLAGLDIPYIVVCQQFIGDGSVEWIIDGLQRLSSLFEFRTDAYKISKTIDRYNIEYQTVENGKLVTKIYDIRNKHYSDLPSELQEQFLDYNIMIVKHVECTDEDIEFHLRRYNSGKRMNQAQSGLTFAGHVVGEKVNEILSSTQLFNNHSALTNKELYNGTTKRIIFESIMATFYIDSWKKRQSELCKFLKENSSIEDFDCIQDTMQRLDSILTDDTAGLFTSKNSFIFITLFNRFKELNVDDVEFNNFLIEFNTSLRQTAVDGYCYDYFEDKNGKDRTNVVMKLNILTHLMTEFLANE